MIEYHAQENSYLTLTGADQAYVDDLVEMGRQIKDKLGFMQAPIAYTSESKVYIGSIVGSICLNDTTLVIHPKVPYEGEEKARIIKTLYERTLKCSMSNLGSTVFFTKSAVLHSEDSFPDVLASLFIASLTNALRTSKILQYQEATEKLRVIKGRVLMGKQLSAPVLDEKTWCKFSQMSQNNIYNQLLFWACRYLGESVHSFALKRRLLLLSREFVPHTDLLSVFSVKALRLTRQFSEYAQALSIAQSVFLGSGVKEGVGTTRNHICGYVINMERAFENIVCYYSQAAALGLGCSHKGQASIRFASANGNYDHDYDIRPDNLISDRGRHLVLDAKYKVLSTQRKNKQKPSRDDFYQMVSSCIAYGCPEAMLIYPFSTNFPSQSWDTVQSVNGRKIRISSIGIDIFGSDQDILAAMTQAIQASYLYKEKAI